MCQRVNTRNKIQRGTGVPLGGIDDTSYIAGRVCRRQPQGAERECQLGWRLQLQPRQLREPLERRQRPAVLLQLK